MRFRSVDFGAPVLNSAVQLLWCSWPLSSAIPSEFPHFAVQLRRYSQRQLGLGCFCQLRRAFERCVQPTKEIPVNEQLVPQQGGKIRKRPSEGRHQLQVAQDQHSNQCVFQASCPAIPFDVVQLFRGCCPPHRSEATLVVKIVT